MAAGRPFVAMPCPGILRVTLPLPFPGLDHVHTYLLEGRDGLVVVDSGLGSEEGVERILQGIRWLGRDPERDVELIVLTHAHPDHIGGAEALQEQTGAPVACHPLAEDTFRRMQSPEDLQRFGDHLTAFGWHPEDARAAAVPLPIPSRIRHLEEGDRLAAAGGAWDVWWTPGHEWGHIVLYRASDRVLVSGDTLLGKITPHVGYTPDPPDPLGAFLGSLDKVARLEASLVLAGHGRAFEDGAERARAIRAHHELRLRRVWEVLLRRGPTCPLEVSREIFGRELMWFQERLALLETLAHLEYLRLRGRVQRDLVDGVWHYELARLVP